MAAIDDLNAKLDAIVGNVGEQAAEVGRIRDEIIAIRALLADGVTAEQAAALGARLDAVVESTQGVEDTLRSTTATP